MKGKINQYIIKVIYQWQKNFIDVTSRGNSIEINLSNAL